eukprot:g40551.t1
MTTTRFLLMDRRLNLTLRYGPRRALQVANEPPNRDGDNTSEGGVTSAMKERLQALRWRGCERYGPGYNTA